MKTTVQYLDAAKRALGIDSDYALAPHLGLTRQAVSKLRNRPLVMSNTTAVKIAEILGADPLKVIADLELERGSSPELWKRIRDAAVVAAVSIGAASFGVAPQPAQAATLHNSFLQPGFSPGRAGPECTLWPKRRRGALALALELLDWLLS